MHLYPLTDCMKTIKNYPWKLFASLKYFAFILYCNDLNISYHAELGLCPRPEIIKFFINHTLGNVDSELVLWF